MCARFHADPKECHLRTMKRILRYLVHTPNFGLWYPKGSNFDLFEYFDVDYAGCKVDRKSTSGTCQFLGRSLVSWSSKKQSSIALSTVRVKYIASNIVVHNYSRWGKPSGFGYNLSKVPLLCDNESAISMADNHVDNVRTKHIDI
jgi:hypothetical protein